MASTHLDPMREYLRDHPSEQGFTEYEMKKIKETRHSLYSFRVDDWLVIRTDMAGHEAIVNTEMWCEWDRTDMDGDYTRRDELNVIDRVQRMHRAGRLDWRGCEEGWCSRCAQHFDAAGFCPRCKLPLEQCFCKSRREG